MKKAGLIKKIIVLVIVLALPGFLYYLLVTLGKNHYKSLRVFGPKQVAKTTHKKGRNDVPDTLYHHVEDFNLTDQNGNPVSFKNLKNKIFIANFFYSHCPGVCSEMNANVKQLVTNYGKSKMVCFVSITVDPARDSASALKKYADSFGAGSPKWLFLTGDTSTIYLLARNGFLVNALQTGKDDFIYSDKLILIDEDKRIRGYYTGAATEDVNRLNDEIKVLLAEEILKHDVPEY